MSEQKRHYQNGRWVTEQDLTVSPLDLAVLRGFGVFDFMTATNGKIFQLSKHLERYESSARQMGLSLPMNRSELEGVIRQGIERSSDYSDLFIRIILTGGVSDDFITPGVPNFMVLFHPATRPAAEWYRSGVKVITHAHQRRMAEVKSLSYAEAVLALQEAKRQHAAEAIYYDADSRHVFEGTGSNIFGVKDGCLITPNEGMLMGVMRGMTLQLAEQLNIPVQTRPVTYEELVDCDEVFITSSIKRILPVRQIDEVKIRQAAGPVTMRLIAALGKLTIN